MQYVPFERGIEVNGQTAYAVVDGFSAFRDIASEILISEKVGIRGPDGLVQIDPASWYSQAAWLRSFERISRLDMGDAALFQIGLAIPLNAKFPDWVIDIETSIRAIDIAYHMNHRINGVPLFHADTGAMYEGIGHYGCEPGEVPRMLVSVCKNPYPCAFDRGILTSMAVKFEPHAKVVHDDRRPCRKKGADSCTYLIVW